MSCRAAIDRLGPISSLLDFTLFAIKRLRSYVNQRRGLAIAPIRHLACS